MTSWTVAKRAFQTPTSGEMKCPRVVDQPGDRLGLTGSVGRDVGGNELVSEHERLVLQRRVEDPEQAEDDLERPLGSNWRGPRVACTELFSNTARAFIVDIVVICDVGIGSCIDWRVETCHVEISLLVSLCRTLMSANHGGAMCQGLGLPALA